MPEILLRKDILLISTVEDDIILEKIEDENGVIRVSAGDIIGLVENTARVLERSAVETDAGKKQIIANLFERSPTPERMM